MRVRGNLRNGDTAMFLRVVWTRARCPVPVAASGVSDSGVGRNQAFRAQRICYLYTTSHEHPVATSKVEAKRLNEEKGVIHWRNEPKPSGGVVDLLP